MNVLIFMVGLFVSMLCASFVRVSIREMGTLGQEADRRGQNS